MRSTVVIPKLIDIITNYLFGYNSFITVNNAFVEQTANIFFNEFLFLASSSICSTVSRVVRIVLEQSIDTASIVACALLGRALLDYCWELVRTWFCLASVVVYE